MISHITVTAGGDLFSLLLSIVIVAAMLGAIVAFMLSLIRRKNR
jgi:type II secretory pathway component PulJ